MSVQPTNQLEAGREPAADTHRSGETCQLAISSVTATSTAADVIADSVALADPTALANCVEEEVARICEANEAAKTFDDHEPNRRELLGLLAFAYARRVFDSEEIAQRCQTEPTFRQLCHSHSPFTGELVSFRRRNRSLLVTVLANVLMRATQAGPAASPPSAALKRQLLCQASATLNLARHFDTGSE